MGEAKEIIQRRRQGEDDSRWKYDCAMLAANLVAIIVQDFQTICGGPSKNCSETRNAAHVCFCGPSDYIIQDNPTAL